MSRKKIKIKNTDTSNLVSNLRGEVGEIIASWTLLRNFILVSEEFRADIKEKLNNPRSISSSVLTNKLSDEIVARLSELAEKKTGRLTFYFAGIKLVAFSKEIKDFEKFIREKKFKKKRNSSISYKTLPEKWEDHRIILIPYKDIVKGVAKALRLMKKIDRAFLGPSSKYLWEEMRKRRYKPTLPPMAGYLMLPYYRLSKENRKKILLEEINEGICKWESINTLINGKKEKVRVNKK